MSDHSIVDAGVGRQVPITRRSAIRTGAFAALAASVAGTIRPPVAAAAPLQLTPPVLGTIADAAHLSAECERLARICRETMTTLSDAGAALPDVRNQEEDDLFRAYDDAMAEHYGATIDLYLAELYRHFPGLAPALRTVAEHIQEGFHGVGTCCDPAGDDS